MKVILLQDVDKVGKKYEVKEVADGFSRNFLIPQGLAKIADSAGIKEAEAQRAILEEKAKEELEKVGKMVSSMDGLEVEIPMKVGDKGQLFEKVGQQRIVSRLKEMGFEIKKDQIVLGQDVEDLGEFPAKVKFDHNLEAEIKLIVSESPESKKAREKEE